MTKTSEVRPELFDGVFDCMECGTASAPVRQQFKYTEVPIFTDSSFTFTEKYSRCIVTNNVDDDDDENTVLVALIITTRRASLSASHSALCI